MHAVTEIIAALRHQCRAIARGAAAQKIVFRGDVQLQCVASCGARHRESTLDETRVQCGCSCGAEKRYESSLHRTWHGRLREHHHRVTSECGAHTAMRACADPRRANTL